MNKKILMGSLVLFLGLMSVVGFIAASDKVTICHVPPGNPDNAHTITIGQGAAENHLSNHEGDYLGECGYQILDAEEAVNTLNAAIVQEDIHEVILRTKTLLAADLEHEIYVDSLTISSQNDIQGLMLVSLPIADLNEYRNLFVVSVRKRTFSDLLFFVVGTDIREAIERYIPTLFKDYALAYNNLPEIQKENFADEWVIAVDSRRVDTLQILQTVFSEVLAETCDHDPGEPDPCQPA